MPAISTVTCFITALSCLNSSRHRVSWINGCIRVLSVNLMYTLRPGPSTWTILTSSSSRCKVASIHLLICIAVILGLLWSKQHITVFCRSLIFLNYLPLRRSTSRVIEYGKHAPNQFPFTCLLTAVYHNALLHSSTAVSRLNDSIPGPSSPEQVPNRLRYPGRHLNMCYAILSFRSY
jgi:hypothetical protein